MTVATILQALAACLCAQITEENAPKTCFCGVVPGSAAIADYAGDCESLNGMAWVRLVNSYPAVGVGVQDETPGSCGTSLGFDIEMGMLRHWPIQAEPKDEAETLAATQLQLDDMMLMRRAVACCDALGGKDYSLGQYLPIGPLGDLVGGSWTIFAIL
jgi:hypothetical protein